MLYFAAKALLSGAMIAAVSEVSRRNPALGALVASLPLVSVFAMVWMWSERVDASQIANHAEATFWLVLPSLPMFLMLPWLLRNGTGFWPSLGLSCALTAALYFAMVQILARFGIVV
ncbi:MAG: DUF3147 family protein [Hyphomicrobiaceae bacterium]|nr:DUF3147 family protein [Hyphomicrobiaceae bacterium]